MDVRVYILLVSTDIVFVLTFTVSGKKVIKLRNCQIEKLGRNTVVIHVLRIKNQEVRNLETAAESRELTEKTYSLRKQA